MRPRGPGHNHTAALHPPPSSPPPPLPDPPAVIYRESLHYVRLQRFKHPLDPRPSPLPRTAELAYPHPPTPPDSSLASTTSSTSSSAGVASASRLVATEPPRRAPLLDDAATATTTAATVSAASSYSSSRRSRAKMAASVVSKPIRRSYVGMVAGLASTVGLGQAMFLKATYQSPPDARGPRCGVERPPRLRETLSSAEGHVARIITSAASAAADTRLLSSAHQAAHAHPGGVHKKRILIIGDSLVSGVGGESSFDDGPSDGPALPRQVARYLSEMLNVDVQWNAMSLTGGDVRMLKRKTIPMLTRERERGTIDDIAAVVLVTGVNDWKRISPLRTASKFRQDLADFITKIRQQVGDECAIFLPAIPGVHHTPRFHEPLRSIVVFLNDFWDSQKVQLSRSMKKVYFVGQPPNHEWGANPHQYFSTLDRVHPSELGYRRWAERIAEHMVAAFRKGVKAASTATQRAAALTSSSAPAIATSAIATSAIATSAIATSAIATSTIATCAAAPSDLNPLANSPASATISASLSVSAPSAAVPVTDIL